MCDFPSGGQADKWTSGQADQHSILRTHDNGTRFCEVTVRYVEDRLSITAASGRAVRRAKAKAEALAYWRGFFEDCPEEMQTMSVRAKRTFRSPLAAARYVIAQDGELHGLDVLASVPQGEVVHVVETMGQDPEAVRAHFPELAPLLPWHLNDMHAGCEHQDALGWGHGKTIALTASTLTPVQRETLDGAAETKCTREREREFGIRWKELTASKSKSKAWIEKHQRGVCSVHDLDVLTNLNAFSTQDRSRTLRAFDRWLREEISSAIQLVKFDAELYKDSLGAPCPECGYRYGSEWLRRPLPADVLALVLSVLDGSACRGAKVAVG